MQIAINQDLPKQPLGAEQKVERIISEFETNTLKTCSKDEINKTLDQVRAKFK